VSQWRLASGQGPPAVADRLTPAEAIVLARGIEPYHPLFYEDPILPDNFDAMGLVAENIHIPIATGERLHTIFEFEMLLRRGAVQFVRPDVCMCGGITGAKKVAALAEANEIKLALKNSCLLNQIHDWSVETLLQGDNGKVFFNLSRSVTRQLSERSRRERTIVDTTVKSQLHEDKLKSASYTCGFSQTTADEMDRKFMGDDAVDSYNATQRAAGANFDGG